MYYNRKWHYQITGDANCLFNLINYSICSSGKFNWKIQQVLCTFIDRNWREVGHLAGWYREYEHGEDDIAKKRMREDGKWGGHIKMCTLSLITGHCKVLQRGLLSIWKE